MKRIIAEDRRERMENFELFPEAILEVKQIIFKEVMATQYE